MQVGKDIALVALGAAMVLAYQKYSKPLMKKVEKCMNDAIEMADEKLDEIM